MALSSSKRSAKLAHMLATSSKARSRVSCRCSRRPSSILSIPLGILSLLGCRIHRYNLPCRNQPCEKRPSPSGARLASALDSPTRRNDIAQAELHGGEVRGGYCATPQRAAL